MNFSEIRGIKSEDFCIRVPSMGSKYFSDEIGVFAPSIGGEQLRALTSATLHIGMRKVDLHALDRAYSIAFPQATPINVNKKCRGKRRDSRFKIQAPET